MGRITVVISDDLEREFRRVVGVRFGFKFKRGYLRVAVEEALRTWIREETKCKKEH